MTYMKFSGPSPIKASKPASSISRRSPDKLTRSGPGIAFTPLGIACGPITQVT